MGSAVHTRKYMVISIGSFVSAIICIVLLHYFGIVVDKYLTLFDVAIPIAAV